LFLNGGRFRNTNTGTSGSLVDIDTTIVLGGSGGIISATGGAAAQVIVQPTSVISGAGPLIKDGNAIISVAAACTYSGATIINDGTLRVRTTADRFPIGTDLTVNSPEFLISTVSASRSGPLLEPET
jgi:autotransporter-associated beta strand protein